MNNQLEQNSFENVEKPPKKCLFIDDHASIIMGANFCFKKFTNFKAVECHSVEEALNAIRANTPDILFLDHSLTIGGSEGIEIADQIKLEKPEIEIYSTTTNPHNVMLYEQRGIKHINKEDLSKLEQVITS